MTRWSTVPALIAACSTPTSTPVQPPPPPSMATAISRPRIVAHRGASLEAPENTIASFTRAWQLGVESCELDVRLSRDGAVVVIHDDRTGRVGGVDRPVVDQTLAELRALDVGGWFAPRFAGEKIPTLAEALATVPPGGTLFVEIKTSADTAAAVAQAIEAADPRPRGGHVALQGFDPDALAALAHALHDIPSYWDVGPPTDDSDRILPYPTAVVDAAVARGFTGLALDVRGVDDNLLAAARAAGLEMDVWTINDADALREWQSRGVRWIETDQPALAPVQ